MEVVGLDGNLYKINVEKYIHHRRSSASNLHKHARDVIQSVFPYDIVLEEVFIPGCNTRLFVDFFVPKRLVVVEVQGEQHSHFVEFFHGDEAGYREYRKRDNIKKQWCSINDITLVEFNYDNKSDWEAILKESIIKF